MSTGKSGRSSSSGSGARMAGSWRNNRKKQGKWQIGGAGMIAAILLAAVLVLAEFGERNAVNASRIIRHTNNKRSSSLNDYQDSSLAKEQHHHQQQQQINGKYLSSNENQLGVGGGGGGSGSDDDSQGAEPGATLFASVPSSSSSLSSPLSHNSPQTLTLTADKNKTKLLKCHCDICKDQNYVCETDGLCFTSLSLEHGTYKYSYRMLESPGFSLVMLRCSDENKYILRFLGALLSPDDVVRAENAPSCWVKFTFSGSANSEAGPGARACLLGKKG